LREGDEKVELIPGRNGKPSSQFIRRFLGRCTTLFEVESRLGRRRFFTFAWWNLFAGPIPAAH
jgi:hypothetical protein